MSASSLPSPPTAQPTPPPSQLTPPSPIPTWVWWCPLLGTHWGV
jgi:hypothetical protein